MLSQILCESTSYHDIQLLPSTIVCDLNFTDLRLLCLWLLISLLLICLSCMPILLHNFDVLWASFQCESLPSIYDNHDNHYFFVSSQTFFNFLLQQSLAPGGIHFLLWGVKNLHPLWYLIAMFRLLDLCCHQIMFEFCQEIHYVYLTSSGYSWQSCQ